VARHTLRPAAIYFAAGALGGFAVTLTVWCLGRLGVAEALGLPIAPALEKTTIYRQMVWGGLWGLVFLLPVRIERWWLRGLVMTLFPVLAVFLYFAPMRGGQYFVLHWGIVAPFYVYVVNVPWGLVTAWLGRHLGADLQTSQPMEP